MSRDKDNPEPFDNVDSLVEHIAKSARAVRAEDVVEEIKRQVASHSIEAIYRDRVLTQRTRSYSLRAPVKNTQVEILHTLLGIELKIGSRRLLCPDLATARYISVFARVGCESIALPYDITQVSRLADELDSSWHRTMLLVDHLTEGRSDRLRQTVRRRILGDLRKEIARLGPGAPFPKFNQNTRQRPRRSE